MRSSDFSKPALMICHIGFVLAIFTGMRRGEVLGVRWRDIDLQNKKLTVNQSLYWIPKQASSFSNLKLITPYREDGSPIKPRNFLEHFDRIIKAAEVPKIRFHDLKHTHATLLLKLGENIKVVSERLGHSRTSTTSDIYTDVLPDMQQGAADRFKKAFETRLKPRKNHYCQKAII